MAPFKFTELILNNQTIDVYGHGKMERDFTYIDDIVDGTVKAIEKNLSWEIINLGQGQPNTLMDFIGLIEKNCGKEAKKNFLPMQPGDVTTTFADITKAKNLLDWTPAVDLETGIEKFVSWYLGYYKV